MCRTLSVRSKKEDEKDLKDSTTHVSCAYIFLPIYSTIRLIKSKGLCTKGVQGHGVAYSALEQTVGPVLVQVKSESQSARCRASA